MVKMGRKKDLFIYLFFDFFSRSLDCVKFVESVLTVSQTERPTAKALLEHPFLKKCASNQQVLFSGYVCVCFFFITNFLLSKMQKMLQQVFLSQAFGDGKKGAQAGIF